MSIKKGTAKSLSIPLVEVGIVCVWQMLSYAPWTNTSY